jgi:hypothetical protein
MNHLIGGENVIMEALAHENGNVLPSFSFPTGKQTLMYGKSASGKIDYLQSVIDVYMNYSKPGDRFQITNTVKNFIIDIDGNNVCGDAVYFGIYDTLTKTDIEPPVDDFLKSVEFMNGEYNAYTNEFNRFVEKRV